MYKNISAIIYSSTGCIKANTPISHKYAFERVCEVLFEAGVKNINIIVRKNSKLPHDFAYRDFAVVTESSSHMDTSLALAKTGLKTLKGASGFAFLLDADFPLIALNDMLLALDGANENEKSIITLSLSSTQSPHFILPKKHFETLLAIESWEQFYRLIKDKSLDALDFTAQSESLLLNLSQPEDFEKIRKRLPKPGAFYQYALETIFVSNVPNEERLHAKEFAKAAYAITQALENKGYSLDHKLSYSGAFLTALSYEDGAYDHADDIFQKLCSIGLARPAAVSAAAFGYGVHEAEISEREIVYLSKHMSRGLSVSTMYLEDTRALKIKENIENALGFPIEKLLKEKNIMEETQ